MSAYPSTQPCPNCGEIVTWDEENFPPAWRHAHDSRWCELREGEAEPVYPAGATSRRRVVPQ